MSSGISGSASAVRLSRKQDGRGGVIGGWDDRNHPLHRTGRATGAPGGIADGVASCGPSPRLTPPAPKEACQATGLGRTRNGQDEDQREAQAANIVESIWAPWCRGARSMHSSLARGLGCEGD